MPTNEAMIAKLRAVLRKSLCDQIEVAFEAEEVLRSIYRHAEPRARNSQPAVGCIEWAATFGPMARAALTGDSKALG